MHILCHTAFPVCLCTISCFISINSFMYSFFLNILCLSPVSFSSIEYSKLIATIILTPPPHSTGLTCSIQNDHSPHLFSIKSSKLHFRPEERFLLPKTSQLFPPSHVSTNIFWQKVLSLLLVLSIKKWHLKIRTSKWDKAVHLFMINIINMLYNDISVSHDLCISFINFRISKLMAGVISTVKPVGCCIRQ